MPKMTLVGLMLVALVAFPVIAEAQTVEIKSGKDAVKIKTGPHGVSVEASDADATVKTGHGGVSVETNDTDVDIGGGHLRIVIGRGARKVKLSKSKPVSLECRGNDDKVLRNLYIKAKKGDGIKVHGNCDLVIIDSYIDVTGYAIRASGNAEVVIKNSTIKGDSGAVRVGGNAEVETRGTVVEGKIVEKGNGEYKSDD
jgi:hypothetical protein